MLKISIFSKSFPDLAKVSIKFRMKFYEVVSYSTGNLLKMATTL